MASSRWGTAPGRIRLRRPRRSVPASAIVPECPEDAAALLLMEAGTHLSLACG